MIVCANCYTTLEDATGIARQSCPECGSLSRIFRETGTVFSRSHASAFDTLSSAPVFTFGAVVTAQGQTVDGELIKLVDPVYKSLLYEIRKNPHVFYQIGPRQWEEIIAAAYDNAGFDEVILTPRSGDFGRDIIAIKHGFGSIKFIEQVKAYHPGHVVKADEVRALLGVLQAEQNASKAIFTTTSHFAPRIKDDKFIKPFLPFRLELIDQERLLQRLLDETEQ